MYLRKWSRMRWFDRTELLSKLMIKKPNELYQLMQRFPQNRDTEATYPTSVFRNSDDPKLLKDLLDKYPDLKYTNIDYSQGDTFSKEGNYVLDFLNHQKSLIKKGYSKEKAFELTEKKFQDRFNQKINESLIANNLAYDNHLRSLLSIAEQTAEAESRFKVQRMTRDLYFYNTAQKINQKTLKDLEKEAAKELSTQGETPEEEAIEQDDDGQTVNLFGKQYKRVLHKIVPTNKNNVEDPSTAQERKEVIDDFIENTQNMFKMYYERAATLDRLSGLSESEIMQSVTARPSKLKRESKELLTKLRKYNITLDAKGDVDYSGCPHPHIVKKLQQNPLVKIALLQDDLQYEFPHKEVQMELARKIREDYDDYKKESERVKKSIVVEDKEESITSDDSPFHKQYNISYPRAELKKEGKLKEAPPAQDLNDQDLLSPDATYRVFETYQERTARLEKKWLKSRLASLEPGVEKPSAQEQQRIIEQAIDKLRRVKYLVDQKNVENAKDLIFEEHKVFSKDEMLADSDVQSEKLIHYLRTPEDKRRLTQTDEIDDDKMIRMVARKNIVEDTVTPFTEFSEQRLGEEDTREYKHIQLREKYLEKERRRLLRASIQEAEEPQGELEATAAKVDPKDASKAERKKLVEYIKQKTDKGAATPAAGDKNAKKGK